jgi:hypothetical protein
LPRIAGGRPYPWTLLVHPSRGSQIPPIASRPDAAQSIRTSTDSRIDRTRGCLRPAPPSPPLGTSSERRGARWERACFVAKRQPREVGYSACSRGVFARASVRASCGWQNRDPWSTAQPGRDADPGTRRSCGRSARERSVRVRFDFASRSAIRSPHLSAIVRSRSGRLRGSAIRDLDRSRSPSSIAVQRSRRHVIFGGAARYSLRAAGDWDFVWDFAHFRGA